MIFKRILARKFTLVGSGKQPTNMGLQEGKSMPSHFPKGKQTNDLASTC